MLREWSIEDQNQSAGWEPRLANFFLIDQSLRKIGGHHYDYARCVARAACEDGFQVTIGTHNKFRDKSLEPFGEIRRTFRNHTYHGDSYLSGLRQIKRTKRNFANLKKRQRKFSYKNLAESWQLARHHARRDSYIRSFARDCERLFKHHLLTENDHAFFTTVNEMEFMGLAAFLSNHPRTLQVTWHLQFHFNLFDGRTPEYRSQHQTARTVQTCFDAAFARIPYHQINFYATSDTLADQFNRLQVGNFQILEYPIRPEIMDPAPQKQITTETEDKPIKITCPGGVRREKKAVEYLQPLVNDIWDEHLASGNVQLILQQPHRSWPAKKKIELQPPRSTSDRSDWVKYYEHPLSDDEYANLIHETDCGLLFYDSRVYFSRRAGVLGELLSCGKPVVVPAGSWLADQIQEPIFRHVESLVEEAEQTRVLQLDHLQWNQDNVPLPGGIVSFDQSQHPFQFEFELQTFENAVAVEFDWHWPTRRGTYCQISLQNGESENSSPHVQVVGHRSGKQNAICFFPTEGTKVRIQLANAFHDASASIRNLSIHALRVPENSPIGAVGVIAANELQLSAAMDEMISHFAHYRQTAETFSGSWCQSHDPRQTVNRLTSRNRSFANSSFSKAG